MSENIKNYEYNRKDLKGIRASTLLKYGEGWEKPTPDEIRLLFEIGGEKLGKPKLTGADVGKVTGSDARSVRRWTAEEGSKGHKYISYAAWRLLLIYVGIVKPEILENEMGDKKVAWVPKQCDEFLTEIGVESAGGKIVEENLTESNALSVALNLNKGAQDTAGKYIVVRM